MSPYPRIERKHRILCYGDFEERTYIDGVLVDIRVYHLVGRRIGYRTRLALLRARAA